jgi:hypothetical protein
MVMVPPCISAGASFLSVARAARSLSSAASSLIDFIWAERITGVTRPSSIATATERLISPSWRMESP